jgi:hypothetical protein
MTPMQAGTSASGPCWAAAMIVRTPRDQPPSDSRTRLDGESPREMTFTDHSSALLAKALKHGPPSTAATSGHDGNLPLKPAHTSS